MSFFGKYLYGFSNFNYKSVASCVRNTISGCDKTTTTFVSGCLGGSNSGVFKLHLLGRACFLNNVGLAIKAKCQLPHRYEGYRIRIFRVTKNYYRGLCHERGLPVRGQRTRSNYRTQTTLASRRYAGSFYKE